MGKGWKAPYAKMDIPLAQIQTIKMGDDHETVFVDLKNGDKLTGVIALGPVELATVFGKVAIGIEHIRKFDVVMGGGIGRKGLLLWNRLGSESEVSNSCVGPGGKLSGGRFVQGRFGNGIELNMKEQLGVTFPVGAISAPAGCIEFWAKLVNFPAELPWGERPNLISVRDEQDNNCILLHFNGNDGVSGGTANGGLCARLPGIGSAGTGTHGTWTYGRALAGGDASEWHHYALVWCTAAMPGVGDGTRRMAVFVDGRLNTASWLGACPTPQALLLPKTGRFGFLTHQGVPSGSVVFDNLKIWNYAKTDFSDRMKE
jgi:hypothetical protein